MVGQNIRNVNFINFSTRCQSTRQYCSRLQFILMNSELDFWPTDKWSSSLLAVATQNDPMRSSCSRRSVYGCQMTVRRWISFCYDFTRRTSVRANSHCLRWATCGSRMKYAPIQSKSRVCCCENVRHCKINKWTDKQCERMWCNRKCSAQTSATASTANLNISLQREHLINRSILSGSALICSCLQFMVYRNVTLNCASVVDIVGGFIASDNRPTNVYLIIVESILRNSSFHQ